jgi:hypothetical protein
VSNDRRRRRGPSGERPWSELTEGPWPCEDPGCLACQLTAAQWEDIHVRVFERGEDVYIVDDRGALYPLELRHVTTGPNGMNEMLGMVKDDARAAARDGHVDHSHTSHMKPR